MCHLMSFGMSSFMCRTAAGVGEALLSALPPWRRGVWCGMTEPGVLASKLGIRSPRAASRSARPVSAFAPHTGRDGFVYPRDTRFSVLENARRRYSCPLRTWVFRDDARMPPPPPPHTPDFPPSAQTSQTCITHLRCFETYFHRRRCRR